MCSVSVWSVTSRYVDSKKNRLIIRAFVVRFAPPRCNTMARYLYSSHEVFSVLSTLQFLDDDHDIRRDLHTWAWSRTIRLPVTIIMSPRDGLSIEASISSFDGIIQCICTETSVDQDPRVMNPCPLLDTFDQSASQSEIHFGSDDPRQIPLRLSPRRSFSSRYDDGDKRRQGYVSESTTVYVCQMTDARMSPNVFVMDMDLTSRNRIDACRFEKNTVELSS